MTKVFIIENNIYRTIKNIKLPSNVYNRITKYKVENDYINSFVAWYHLLKILKEDYNIIDPVIYENEHHKPLIDGIYFNISHSNNLVIIGISDNNIGLDIEMINSLKDLTLIKKRLFNDELIDNDSVIKKWTKLEAMFKYDGTGIIYSNLNNIFLTDQKLENTKTFEVFDSNNNKYYYSIKLKENDEIKINFIH